VAALADRDAVFGFVSAALGAGVKVVGLDPEVAAATFGISAVTFTRRGSHRERPKRDATG